MLKAPVLLSLCFALTFAQPKIESRRTPVLKVGGQTFRDLNKNGRLDKYEDWRLPVDQRVADLVSQMTVEEKAGLMIHTSLMGFTGPNGEVLDAAAPGAGFGPPRATTSGPPNRALNGRPNMNNVTPMDRPNPAETILKRNIRWVLVRPNPREPAEVTAKFHNGLQEMAEGSRLGIPIAFSSDPRHAVRRTGPPAPPNISQWPEQLGLGAIGDAEAVREFGRIAAKELRAIGIAVTLSPMADVATEPRWGRISGTFGEDAELVAKLTKAYIEGFQGKKLGPESVLCVTKHFPGDGPVKDGYDPHNNYGKWTIYPGHNFDYHLIPFKSAFEAVTGAIMTGYFIPVGKDTVAIAYSRAMTTDLLRDKMAFNGLVVTDWLRNMPWGAEKLSEKDRQKQMVLAGIDQIGGDNDPKYIIESVRNRSISEARLDVSAKRVLKPMFELGLFEDPFVDAEGAKNLVASREFMEAGHRAQVKSLVLLKNANGTLPAAKKKIYVENMSKEEAGKYGTVVENPAEAELALIRVNAAYANYPYGGSFFAATRVGTLAYADAANSKELDAIKKLAATGVPTVVIVEMDRPGILTEFIDSVAAVLASFGTTDAAALDVVFGRYSPSGKLPVNLPSDMPSVMAQAADVPHDLDDPLFKFGFGLTYR